MGMGSGAMNLQAKTHCVLKGLHLESESTESLRRVCRLGVRSFTTDLGTEAGLGDVVGDIHDFMPPWQHHQVRSTPETPASFSPGFQSL